MGHHLRPISSSEHLTPQRSNGFRSMVDRMRRDAHEAIAEARLIPLPT